MSKFFIVWNESKNEGVIFSAEKNEDEAMDDAYHAGGGMIANPVSSVGDYFRETYGECQDCFIQTIDINNESSIKIEKDF